MPLIAAAAQIAWAAMSAGSWRHFRKALHDPAAAQRAVLRAYLDANSDTVFGRMYGFAGIRSVEEYQQRVPIATYDDIDSLFQRVAAGEPSVLTREDVRTLAPSSGSTRASKLIPYTRTLQRELSRAVDSWVFDLRLQHPRLIGGPAYWSITPPSPPAGLPPTPIPIGFEDDSRYLGGASEILARATIVTPPRVDGGIDGAAFRHATLRTLLLARELRLISVWHPSFLSLLLDTLESAWGDLLADVAESNPGRAARLRSISPSDILGIWPRLTLVSCWGDGPSETHADLLAARLPGIELQRKGLIATEGIVTVPFQRQRPIAVTSHFFEFLEPDGRPRLAHELKRGVDYRVVLTTGGGLYRYALGDRVRVDGYHASTPSLRFIGKEDRISDRRGEKLSDGFVATVLDAIFAARSRPRFAMLAPEETPVGVGYTLFVDRDAASRSDLADALERELRRNPHYAWCVDLGQLRPAAIAAVRPDADRAYVDACVARGQRRGDVKPVSLDPSTGWRSVYGLADAD